jgi:hypothetical protein
MKCHEEKDLKHSTEHDGSIGNDSDISWDVYGLYLVWDTNCSEILRRSQSHVTTYGQSVSLSWCKAPVWGLRPDFYFYQRVAGLLMWGALSDEKTGLSFTISAGSRQHSHSRVRVSRDSWPYFTVSGSRLPQPGGTGPRIYIPQEQGGPVIPPGTGFPFRRLLRHAGLRVEVFFSESLKANALSQATASYFRILSDSWFTVIESLTLALATQNVVQIN